MTESLVLAALRCAGIAVLLALSVATAGAQTDELGEINKLIKASQFEQAAARIDQALTGKPKDAQLRFLKGVVLTDLKKSPEAVDVFLQLSGDFPELPEPYNNLAVIYASQGQYAKARAALDMAIKVAPSWGTAHENLGDVYVMLAEQSYDKAVQLEPHNTAAARKLSLSRDLAGHAAVKH